MLKWTIGACAFLAIATGQAWAQSSDEDSWAQCGGLNNQPRRPEGCTAIIESGTVKGDDQAMVYGLRGLAYLEQGNAKLAIADFTTAIDAHLTDTDKAEAMLLGRGKANIMAHKADDAIADFTAAIRIKPTDGGAFGGLGTGYFEKAQYAEAIKAFDKSLSMEPRADTRSNRAYALLKLKRYREASADYSTALKQAPDSPQALYGRGLAEQALGDRIGASRDMAAAEKISPGIGKAFEQ